MDRRSPRALLIALACIGASASTELPIREARWIAPGRTLAVLTTEPGECFVQPADVAEAARAGIGWVAFRAPLLLGGQGARAGLSCASCHRNGRGNPDFVFPGLSGAPGTADVTASLMSSHRGDGTFNPKPIPDLGRDSPKVARAALRGFIQGLIVEEFDGPPPPSAVVDGLVAYVQAMDAKACKDPRAVTLAGTAEEASGAAQIAMIALDMGEPATARVMLGGARAALGRIDERLAGPQLAHERSLIRGLDARLMGLQLAIDRQDGDVGEAIDIWLIDLSEIASAMGASKKLSLFDRDRLAAALSASRTP